MVHPLLKRQLTQLGIDDEATTPSGELWRRCLERISRTYAEADQERELLEQSLAISSREMRDLYERVQHVSETRIAAERDRLRAVISSLGAGLGILDGDDRLVSMNPEGERLLGWNEEDLAGQLLLPLILAPDPDGRPAAHLHEVRESILAGRSYRDEDGCFRRCDGATFPVSFVLNPILEDGVLIGSVLVFLDISETKRVEAELEQRLRETLLLNRVIAAAASSQDPASVLTTICEELARAFDLPQAAFALLDDEQANLVVVAEYCAPGRPAAIGVRIPIAGNATTQYVLEQRVPITIGNAQVDPRHHVLHELHRQRGTVSLLIVPLVIRNKVLGTLGLDALSDRRFTTNEIALAMNAAAAASQALENLQLYSAVQQELAERKRAEEALRESEKRYRTVVDNSQEVIFEATHDGRWTFLNPAWQEITGFTPQESIGRMLADFVHSDDRQDPTEMLQSLLSGRVAEIRQELRLMTRGDAQRWIEVHARLTPGTDGVTSTISGTIKDITERKALEEQLTHQAFHDPLSQLPNRALFMDRLRHAVTRLERRQSSLAVLFLDLDNFKLINDSLGHHIGDLLLMAVAERLCQCVRTEDTAARLGGDEFTVLLEDFNGIDQAIRVAKRIQEQLQLPFNLDGYEVFVTASVGIAVSTSEQDSPESLLRNADVAMYRAKLGGKARLEIFDRSMSAQVMERLELEADLRRAITRDEFRVHYQPVVDLATGRISELEALVRWEHPKRGLVSPAEFIPVAEETGLILTIGKFVLEEACRQVREWQLAFPSEEPLILSVNLSARQFQNPALEREVAQTLRATGFDPGRLKLEITESVMMHEAEATVGMLGHLKRLGIKLAIDDFGTGYSSLTYLQRFPLDILKIDRSFVHGIGEEASTMAIIRMIMSLARTLNLRVTGEGIETPKQLAALRAEGCDLGQGFLFARPLLACDVRALLAHSGAAQVIELTAPAPVE
jgi:diguanylate cyclase (GGDEF)-like protein/PAS domain S-box-containing protein